MANPQPTDSHLRIANSIYEEIMSRDFSKRQRNILDLILRLSWGCGKRYAIIPRIKDFEVAGIHRTHVRKELEYLEKCRVIVWNRELNLFALNKDYDTWAISYSKTADDQGLSELIHLNIADKQQGESYDELVDNLLKSYQNSNSVTKTVTGEVTKTVISEHEITETVTAELPKQYAEGYQNSNFSDAETPDLSTVSGAPITSIITSNYNTVATTAAASSSTTNAIESLVQFIANEFLIAPSPYQMNRLLAWVEEDGMDPELVRWACEEALAANVRKVSYVERILERCRNEGIKTRAQAETQKKLVESKKHQGKGPPNIVQRHPAQAVNAEQDSGKHMVLYKRLRQLRELKEPQG